MLKGLVFWSVCFAVFHFSGGANAKARMGTDVNPNVFKADGRVVSPSDAVKLAPDHEIERCSPKKNVTDVNGNALVAYSCKVVVLEFNKKTGMPSWKAE